MSDGTGFGERTGASSIAVTLKTCDGRAVRRVHSALLGDIIQDPEPLQGFYAALRSGGLFTAKEIQVVTQMRQTIFQLAEHKMREYNSLFIQITDLAARLNQLESEHRLALEYHQSCTKLLRNRDFRTLPVEVVSLIFQHTLPQYPHPDPKEAPLLLCRVSSVWRNIVQSLPTLWTDIWLPCAVGHSLRRAVTSDDAKLLHQSWIENRGQIPMSLSLMIHTRKDIEWLEAVLPTIDPPVRRLAIHHRTPWDIPDGLLNALQTALASSRSSIEAITFPNRHDWQSLASFFNTFPNLRQLCLEPPPSDLPSQSQWGIWSNLTALEITSHMFRLGTHQWRAIIGQCANLESGTFIFQATTSPPTPSDSPFITVTLPALRTLTLDIMGQGTLSDILQGILFPALRSLKVKGTWPHLTWNNDDLTPFTTNRTDIRLQALERIVLNNVDISRVSIDEILRWSPSLGHIDIRLPYNDNPLLQDVLEDINSNYTQYQATSNVSRFVFPPGIQRTIRFGVKAGQALSMILPARTLIALSQAVDKKHSNQRGYPSTRITFSIHFPIGARSGPAAIGEQLAALRCAVQEAMDQIGRQEWTRYIQVEFGGCLRTDADRSGT